MKKYFVSKHIKLSLKIDNIFDTITLLPYYIYNCEQTSKKILLWLFKKNMGLHTISFVQIIENIIANYYTNIVIIKKP